MITAQEARENMEKSFEGFMDKLSEDIISQSSRNLDYLVVTIPVGINMDSVIHVLTRNGFMVGGDVNCKDTFEVSW